MAEYTRALSGNFSVTVTLPGDHSAGADVQNVQIGNQDPISAITSFEGRKFIPGLPKTQFRATLLYLKQAPGGAGFADTDLGDSYNITIDNYNMEGTFTSLSWQTQDLGEGVKGMAVTPTYVYIGTRGTNCPVAPSP